MWSKTIFDGRKGKMKAEHNEIINRIELKDFVIESVFNTYGDNKFIVNKAFTLSGDYIGEPNDAIHIIYKKGIAPEKAYPNDSVCSIGFCEREQKWYGWSHRAIFGFGIGDTTEKGDVHVKSNEHSEALNRKLLPIGFKAKTLDDAKRMAIAFADSVS